MAYKTPPNVTFIPALQNTNSSTSMIPSLISGGASIVGGAIDAISNAINYKKSLRAQQAENEKNRQHAIKMYEQFESPQAQARQLQAAGLNPAAQGAVSTQSVGSASTGALPTPAPSSFGSSIAEGAQAAVNSYIQRKQFQQQLDADALNQTRNFFLELSRLDLDRQELQVQLDLWREQIFASKVSREYQLKINKQLQEFMDNGGNQFQDESDSIRASIAESQQRISNMISDKSLTDTQIKAARYALQLQQKLEPFIIRQSKYSSLTTKQGFYKLKQETRELIDTEGLRKALLAANVSSAEIDNYLNGLTKALSDAQTSSEFFSVLDDYLFNRLDGLLSLSWFSE